MCGIFAVLRAPSDRKPPSRAAVDALLQAAATAAAVPDPVRALNEAATQLNNLDRQLRGAPGMQALIADPAISMAVAAQVATIAERITSTEQALDAGELGDAAGLEDLNRALVSAKDATWALTKDRLRTAEAVRNLLGPIADSASPSAVETYLSVQLTLSALDRLEVRGRDSAGVAVILNGHGLSPRQIDARIAERTDPLLLSGAVQRAGEGVAFVYKAAAEIGALGDNVAHLRQAIATDDLLRELAQAPGAWASVVAHTRWASVGTVSEPNAHPLDSQVTGFDPVATPYVLATLNGDIDNYAALKTAAGITVADEITTDAKVIPVLVGRRLAAGDDVLTAFRSTVGTFEGSVAITAAAGADPERLLFAVHGSGQGCYIGLAEDAFLVASEPYGVVEECDSYVRLDGESVASDGTKGQVVDLSRHGAGTLGAIRRHSYGGAELPVGEADLTAPEVTTRDIDRGDAPHFLLKEIAESPQAVRRTLRGKVAGADGRLAVTLPTEALPDDLRAALADGSIDQIIVIGQGTASIASKTLVTVLEAIAPDAPPCTARPATELSGFGLRDDMSDTLIVAVSQSGTTTDTNRTVDLVRARGAKVIAIVNRRQSDLTEKADGVLYTSDGRDVEMSVASTKAFYAQVTAASLLAVAIADATGTGDRQAIQALLAALRRLPEVMAQVLERRPEIAEAAQRFAPHRRSWAIVGNGPNHIAAAELRIKLSELCYKSIACDITEDKKHIDLSAEPMILVCATGLTGANAVDVAKEVAIYQAHKATAIVIATEGVPFDAAAALVTVPALHPVLDFVLSTVAGHLFGYEAALAIDAQGRLMRSARAVLDDLLAGDLPEDTLQSELAIGLAQPAAAIFAELRTGALDGHLQPSTAVRLASLLQYGTGLLPLDSLEVESGRPMPPSAMAADLLGALTAAVDELTRPIDAVKHQAKTVTVGISRTEDTFADNAFVGAVLATGVLRDSLGYRALRTLAALAPAVTQVIGYTRYEVGGDMRNATIRVTDRSGVATELRSRTENDPRLTGTKHRAAFERQVTVGRGQRDGRSVVIVPEVKDRQVIGITLLHVEVPETLVADVARGVLTGYRGRYSAIVDAVTETESHFDDSVLADVPMIDLLVEPVKLLADNWRH